MSLRSVACFALACLTLATGCAVSAPIPDSLVCESERQKGDLAAASAAYGQAWKYQNVPQSKDALACFRVSMTIQSQILGPFAKLTKDSIIGMAMALSAIGQRWDAEELLKVRLKMEPPNAETWKMHVELLHYLGHVAGLQKRYRDQEAAYLDALALSHQFAGTGHLDTARSLNKLAHHHEWQGNRDKAIALVMQALVIQEEYNVPNTNQYIHDLLYLAGLYSHTSDSPHHREAEEVLLKALRFAEKRLARTDRDLSQIHMRLTAHYFIRRLLDKARYHSREEVLAIEAAEGPDSPHLSNALSRAAQLHAENKKFGEAVNVEHRACTLIAKNVSHYPPIESACWSNLADLLAHKGQWSEAYETVKKAASRLREHELTALRTDSGEARERKTSPDIPFSYTFLSQIHKGWVVYSNGTVDKSGLAAETFEAAQWATRTRAADALSRTTARMSARVPDLGDLVRRRETLNAAKDDIERMLIDELNKPNRSADMVTTLHTARTHRQQALDDLSLEILKRFPTYATLSNPAPLSIEALQSLLKPEEVLVLFLVMDRRDTGMLGKDTFTWFVSKAETRWVRSDLGTQSLTEKVQALRCGLDAKAWDGVDSPARCASLLRVAMPAKKKPLPFHLGIAHELYQGLFGQAEDMIKGKRLLVVPTGPLTSLPLHVLVTKKPATALPKSFEGYRGVAWLGRAHAMSVLPSVASLKSLREHVKSSQGSQAYIGYGNPVLAGHGDCKKSQALDTCPSIEAVSAQPQEVASAKRALRATVGGYSGRKSPDLTAMFAQGATTATVLAKVRRLFCPLPETAYEIRCVAERLGISSAIRLDVSATETDIKSLSEQGTLASYRVVHFATHGILAGDVEEITKRHGEPALVMTPPKESNDKDDDGLLMASEVAGLKLNADWVVLSACNTASADKPGAEALSGLARAFFYAGARALLVSHWPVYSDAAVLLTTQAFNAMDQHKETSRAAALQTAMIALMDDPSQNDNAHPAVWAPFVFVGEEGF